MDIWAGFVLGFLGSFHCVGMCGPIALALPYSEGSGWHKTFTRISYNLGRIVTYSLMGVLLGAFGKRLVLSGLQQYVSVIFGVSIILYVILPTRWKAVVGDNYYIREINNMVKSGFSFLMRKNSANSFFLFGMLNGMLPCGFVYVALVGAVTMDSALNGAIYMALFGLGTFPIMFATSMLGQIITLNVRKRINKLVPVFAVVLAFIFILRGLSLGIPYISPKLTNPVTQQEETLKPSCH